MYWKKLFFVGLILLLFLSSVNAIVVRDITDQIDEGNKKIIENNAKIAGDVSQLKEQIKTLQQQIQAMDSELIKWDDIPKLEGQVNSLMGFWQQQLLIMFLVIIGFSFLVFVYGKSRGVF